jgi:hypothetical protein
MTTIAMTNQGPVTGTNSALVEAAAAVVVSLPAPRSDRFDDLVAAVRAPWARVSVSG